MHNEYIQESEELRILDTNCPFSKIVSRAESHFGCSVSELTIKVERTPASLLYDLDSSDWDTYIIIRKKK